MSIEAVEASGRARRGRGQDSIVDGAAAVGRLLAVESKTPTPLRLGC
jgi:hypothetical protein